MPVEGDHKQRRSVAELEVALAREERIAGALREVGNALGTTLDLDDLLELILGKVTELLEADRATLYLLDEASKELVSRLVVGQKVRSIRVRVGHGIAGMVAQTGRPIRLSDAYADERFERQWDALTGYRTTSMLAAPLKNHLGRTIGVIQVLNKVRGAEFTVEDEALLTALSTQAAVAIDNSRLFLSLIQKNKQLLDTKEQLERRLRDLELLFDLERSTARASSIETLLTAVLSRLVQACDALGAAVLLAEEESGDLVSYVLDGVDPEVLGHIGVKAGEGFLYAAMEDDEPLKLENARSDARWSARVEGAYAFPVDSVLAIPLEGDTGALGAIGLFGKIDTAGFSLEDLSLLRLVGANTSTAVRLFRANRSREVSERLTTIGRLLSQVIHDFKTPMTVISGYVQLMADTDEAEKRAEFAEEVLRQFDQLTAMQREVLEFARGERNIFIRKVYLKKFFADITRQLGHEVDGRAIELDVEVDTKVVARFDEGRVARAIFNLARNGVEAMAERGGKLTISAGMEDSELVIRVSDTGPGIPAEIEGRLFQSFVSAGKQGGTGLGLAIVKKIVEEHGGRVEVETSKRGASFALHLPQEQVKAKAKAEPRPAHSARIEELGPNSEAPQSIKSPE
ncbi:MAG: GAF domain-containing protein [Myxococcales bacterium]|nr:GAF domain-containing protein [Myxococcales bacterium]MCB9579839.1 GAF domain-containing protein [Polyangiaceae bacterium]